MQQEPPTLEEISTRKQEDIYIQEGKKAEDRMARARLVAEARLARAKEAARKTQPHQGPNPL